MKQRDFWKQRCLFLAVSAVVLAAVTLFTGTVSLGVATISEEAAIEEIRTLLNDLGWVEQPGDGQEELICNTASLSGERNVLVYQRRGDEIWRGGLSPEGLPDFVREGTGPSLWGEYDPEENLFHIYYRAAGQEGYAETEARGMEQLEFYPYT